MHPNPVTEERLAELRELVANATPGPWRAGRPDMATVFNGYNSKYVYSAEGVVAVSLGVDKPRWRQVVADAEYIATFNPDTILQLLNKIEQLDAEARWLAEQCSIFIDHDTAENWRKEARLALDEIRRRNNDAV